MKRILVIVCLWSATAGAIGQKPPPGTVIDPSHPLSQGLIAAWFMNEAEGTTTLDATPHNSTGTFQSTPTWEITEHGIVIEFDDAGPEWINVGSSNDILPTEQWSVYIFCVDNSGGANNRTCYIAYDSTALSDGYFMGSAGASPSNQYVYLDGAGDASFSSQGYTDGTWTHWSGTYNGATITLWKDGVAADTSAQTGSITYGGTTGVSIGYTDTTYAIEGQIACVLMYDRALSLHEQQLLKGDSYQMAYSPAMGLNLMGGVLAGGSSAMPVFRHHYNTMNQ